MRRRALFGSAIFGLMVSAGVDLACGSSSSSSPSSSSSSSSSSSGTTSGGSSGGGYHLTVTTDGLGSATYTCGPTSGLVPVFEPFDFFCNVATDGGSFSAGVIQLAAYHGSGSYTVLGNASNDGGTVQLELNGYQILGRSPTATTAGSTCTVTIDGPATLKAGDAVKGTFHCENLDGLALQGTAGPKTVPTKADGTFDGVVSTF